MTLSGGTRTVYGSTQPLCMQEITDQAGETTGPESEAPVTRTQLLR